ncbi:MAG: hypothetical protein ABGX83_05420 [Nitrospira sp.]
MPKKPGEEIITVRMSEKLHTELGHIRVDTKRSMNSMIVDSIKTFVQSYNMIQKAKRRKR